MTSYQTIISTLKREETTSKMEFQLSQQTVTVVKNGQFGPYVAVGRRKEKATRWVFLSTQAWTELTNNIDKVTAMVKQGLDKEETIVLTKRVKLTASCFKDRYYIGIHSTDRNGQRIKGHGMNLNMDEWSQLAQ